MDLFTITTRRNYTPEHTAKHRTWAKRDYEDFVRPVFGESAETIARERQAGYDRAHVTYASQAAMYRDTVHSVVPADWQDAKARLSDAHRAKACCGLAVYYPCVCSWSILCPEHGQHCHGSHD